ncbi:MAG: DUF3617 family protein [Xanthobacteraceae bacterium]|nr:DUF3617 family protein [Xanthobacteraceae bacterium]
MGRRGRSWIRLSICALALGAAAPAIASAEDLPTRKPGLWELRMTTGPLPAMTMQQCTDEAIDRQMSTMFGPLQKEMCARNEVQKTAAGYTVDTTCNAGAAPLTSHLDITGDFQSAYTVKVSAQAGDAPAESPPDASLVVEAKWVGPCKADQKPGDIVMGSLKMNIRDIENLRPHGPAAGTKPQKPQ